MSTVQSQLPVIVAGGGVLYGLATDELRTFAEAHGVPVAETQAGKGAPEAVLAADYLTMAPVAALRADDDDGSL